MSKCFLAEGCLFLSPTPFLTFRVNAQSVCSQRSGDLTTLEVTLATEVFTDLHVPASWCRLAFWPHHHEELYKVLFLCRSIPLLPEAVNPPTQPPVSPVMSVTTASCLREIPVHHLLYESQGYPCRS